MIYVWHHGPRANTSALVGRKYLDGGKSVFGMRSTLLFACVLAVPVVLLWWSFLSFIAAVLVYAFRGQMVDPATNASKPFSVATHYIALASFIGVVDCGILGYVFMWIVWKPISEPWARMGRDVRGTT
ncbi:hypothetical protein AURDEDRAFT_145874 [Auricularia subglabra TFB-10046 SS5]|nr:hypothetical protein AURDEDRAFT_145874 [Auricularia subglabra TFB-10046 SS5]